MQEEILSVFSQFVEEIVDEYEDNQMIAEEYAELIDAIEEQLDGESNEEEEEEDIYCDNCGCLITDKDKMVERDGNYFCSTDCKVEYYGNYCDYCGCFIDENEEVVQGANGETFCSDFCAEHYETEESEEEQE